MTERVRFWGPPGTGKTNTLIELVAEAIRGGYHPKKICYTSFTRSGAYEGAHRAIEKFGDMGYEEEDFPYFRTEHSICFRLLELRRDQVFTMKRLKDFSERYPTYEFYFEDDAREDGRFPDSMLRTEGDYYEFFISWMKNTMLPFHEAYTLFLRSHPDLPDTFKLSRLESYIERRTRYKEENSLWDFTDMLVGVLEKGLCPPVSVLISDEMQDASKLLYQVIDLWSKDVDRFYIAGDPYQAIYTFQGAAPELFFQWPMDDSVLSHSYRLTQPVKDYAEQIINSVGLELPDFTAAVDRAGEVKAGTFNNINWDTIGDTLFLVRTRWLLNQFADQLIDKGIPFQNERGKNIITTTKGRAMAALIFLAESGALPLWRVRQMLTHMRKPYLVHGAKVRIEKLPDQYPFTGGDINNDGLRELGFTELFFKTLKDNPVDILNLNVEQSEKTYLHKVWKRYGKLGFLEVPKIKLTTIHGAKGREAATVVLCPDFTRQVTEGYRHDKKPETFLAYVGVTRTLTRLIMLRQQQYSGYPYPKIG